MKNIEIGGYKMTMPSGVEDVKVVDYIELLGAFSKIEEYKNKYPTASEEFIVTLIISDLLKIFVKGDFDVDDLPLDILGDINKELEWLINLKTDDIHVEGNSDKIFEIDGKRFKFLKDFNKLTIGEYSDLNMMLSNENVSNYYQGMDIILIMFLREVDENGKMIKISNPYDYREKLLNLPVVEVGWISGFF